MTNSSGTASEAAPDTSFGGDNWVEGVMEALTRAAKQAHLIAYQTGSGVAYQRNGKFGVYPPDPAMYEDLIPPPFVEQPEH